MFCFRELYYENCDIFSSQDQVDKALNSISCLLDSQLYELNVYASSKGLIYGPVDIIIGDEVINCLINGGKLNYIFWYWYYQYNTNSNSVPIGTLLDLPDLIKSDRWVYVQVPVLVVALCHVP